MGKSEQALADITHWIGGQRVTGAPARTGQVFNPATGDVTGSVRLADASRRRSGQSGARCVAGMERNVAAKSSARDVSLQGAARAQP